MMIEDLLPVQPDEKFSMEEFDMPINCEQDGRGSECKEVENITKYIINNNNFRILFRKAAKKALIKTS